MIGAVEGYFKEADGGGWRESGLEILDVERGVYEGDLVITLFFNL